MPNLCKALPSFMINLRFSINSSLSNRGVHCIKVVGDDARILTDIFVKRLMPFNENINKLLNFYRSGYSQFFDTGRYLCL